MVCSFIFSIIQQKCFSSLNSATAAVPKGKFFLVRAHKVNMFAIPHPPLSLFSSLPCDFHYKTQKLCAQRAKRLRNGLRTRTLNSKELN